MIKINGTRLAIMPLNFKMGDVEVSGYTKKKLKYQHLLFRSSEGDYRMLSICGIMKDKATVPSSLSSKYSEAWGLIKTEGKYSSISYTAEDKRIMQDYLCAMIEMEHFDTAENLCFALNDEEISKRFYSAYGREALKSFCEYVKSNIPSTSGSLRYSKIYQRNRYSVYQLVKDLVEDKSMIYTDPSLIGSYTKISRGVRSGSSFVPDRWSKVIDFSGNMTRANLSLTYSGPHFVNIPENEFGITSGLKEVKAVKSFCIVKDGLLWTTQLGVKVNNKRLLNKFRGAGILKSNLVYDDEYLLDLTQIPIIGKSSLRFVKSGLLAAYEGMYEMRKINIEYYTRAKYKAEKGLSKLPEKIELEESEKFLHSLGIYGENYIPPHVSVDIPSREYETLELVGIVNGLPNNIVREITSFINKGKCRNSLLQKLLQESYNLAVFAKNDYNKLIKEEIKCKDQMAKNIRDHKFRLIMGKTLRFSDKVQAENSKIPTTLGKDYIETTVEWKTKKTKVIV